MSQAEWESLCDGCGRCCLVKLEDDDTGDIHLTRLSCRLLDVKTCRCSSYETRFEKMADCVEITRKKIAKIKWLPTTCAYRGLAEGRDLAWWHPLVSGDPETVHQAGISVVARHERGAGQGGELRAATSSTISSRPEEARSHRRTAAAGELRMARAKKKLRD